MHYQRLALISLLFIALADLSWHALAGPTETQPHLNDVAADASEMNPAVKNSGRTTASAVTTFNRRRCTALRSGTSLSITCACAPISPEPTNGRSQNSLSRHRTESVRDYEFHANPRDDQARPLPGRRRFLKVRRWSSQGAESDRKCWQCGHCCPCTRSLCEGCSH